MLDQAPSVHELNGAQAQLAAMAAASPDAMYSCSFDGIILSWNPGAERLFGYTASEAIGESVTMLVPPELLDRHAALRVGVLRGETLAPTELGRLRKDGDSGDYRGANSQHAAANSQHPIAWELGRLGVGNCHYRWPIRPDW